VASRATGIGANNASDIARAVLGAEAHFHNGEALLRKGDFARAKDAFALAMHDNPQEPTYRAYAAWARFGAAGTDKDRLVRETIGVLGNVLNERPRFALARYWQGQLYKHLGDVVAAEAAFRAAVNDDKSLLDAERELRVLEMRRIRAETLAAAAPADRPSAISAARPRTGLTGKFLKR
jgi:tetratricopeptide (TPR) repeat protein